MAELASPRPTTRTELEAANARLLETVRFMEAERGRLVRERRLHLLLLGLAVSLPVHIALMIWLGSVYLARPGSPQPQGVSVSLSTLSEETLTEAPQETPFEDLSLSAVESSASSEPSPAITASTPAVAQELASGSSGSLSIPGGGGGGGVGMGLGGGAGGGGTSFFGTGAHGVRFAYIVDASGSMESAGKAVVAARELGRSIEALPDFSFFYVVLFNADAYRPPWEDGWMRARKSDVTRLRRWLGEQQPTGGTYPLPAFAAVFALDVPPDVIYFMTDGQIPTDTPAEVARLNARGKRVVIHTIAFGDESGREALQKIAQDSGGSYRFVNPSGY